MLRTPWMIIGVLAVSLGGLGWYTVTLYHKVAHLEWSLGVSHMSWVERNRQQLEQLIHCQQERHHLETSLAALQERVKPTPAPWSGSYRNW